MWHLSSDFRFLRESEDEERDGWQAGHLIASRSASVLLRRTPGPEDKLGRCSSPVDIMVGVRLPFFSEQYRGGVRLPFKRGDVYLSRTLSLVSCETFQWLRLTQ